MILMTLSGHIIVCAAGNEKSKVAVFVFTRFIFLIIRFSFKRKIKQINIQQIKYPICIDLQLNRFRCNNAHISKPISTFGFLTTNSHRYALQHE